MTIMQRLSLITANRVPFSKISQVGLRGICFADGGGAAIDYSKPFKLSAETLRGFVQYLVKNSPPNTSVGHRFLVCLLDNSIAVAHSESNHLKMAETIWGRDQAEERSDFSGGYLPITKTGNNKVQLFFSSSSTYFDDELGRPIEMVNTLRQETMQAVFDLATKAGLVPVIKRVNDNACTLEIALPIR